MAEPLRPFTLAVTFVLGACAATAVQTAAQTDATLSQPAQASAPTPAPADGAPPAAVIALDQAEQRVAPSGKARVTILARGREAFVAKLEMDPGAAVPEHRDTTEEYIHVLEGGGTITIEDRDYEIGPGSTVFMPANAKVSFTNGDAKLVGLQVFAGPEPAAKYDAWTPASP